MIGTRYPSEKFGGRSSLDSSFMAGSHGRRTNSPRCVATDGSVRKGEGGEREGKGKERASTHPPPPAGRAPLMCFVASSDPRQTGVVLRFRVVRSARCVRGAVGREMPRCYPFIDGTFGEYGRPSPQESLVREETQSRPSPEILLH